MAVIMVRHNRKIQFLWCISAKSLAKGVGYASLLDSFFPWDFVNPLSTEFLNIY